MLGVTDRNNKLLIRFKNQANELKFPINSTVTAHTTENVFRHTRFSLEENAKRLPTLDFSMRQSVSAMRLNMKVEFPFLFVEVHQTLKG